MHKLSPGIKKLAMQLIADDNIRKRKLSRLPEVSPESQVATTSEKEPKGKCEVAGNRKRTRWTHEETLKLIDCYESRACLWDAFDKEYHSKEKRERALNEIELELDVSVEEIQAKILNLWSQLGRGNCSFCLSFQSRHLLHIDPLLTHFTTLILSWCRKSDIETNNFFNV